MLGGAQHNIRIAQCRRLARVDPASIGKCGQCRASIADAERRIPAAMDQLMDLGEKLDFANATAASLQVIARPERLPLRMMIADPPGDLDDFADCAEIQATTPDEGPDRFEKGRAKRHVAGRRARANERRTLPRQRLRFVIHDRRVDRDCDRRHLRRRTQPQVDTQNIAVRIARLQKLDHTATDTDRGVDRLLVVARGQRARIEQEDRIDVRRIVQLPAALLAKRDRREAGGGRVRRPFANRGADRLVQRHVREVSEAMGNGTQIENASQIPDRYLERQASPSEPERLAGRQVTGNHWQIGQETGERLVGPVEQIGQKRRPVAGSADRIGKHPIGNDFA